MGNHGNGKGIAITGGDSGRRGCLRPATEAMHMKTPIRFFLSAALFVALTSPSLASAEEPALAGYETGFETIVKLTGDLHQALDRKHWPELSTAPILMPNVAQPCLQTSALAGTRDARAVALSASWVDLVNYISHAKAIDGVSRGFFVKAMARLALEGGEKGTPDLQASTIRNAWSFATMNRQASSFNQMAGALVAIEMAHAYLGHYQKYASQLTDPQNQPVPINRVVTHAEWHEAVMLGARHALDCGFAVDGLKMAFESIDKMPARPPWRAYFLPDSVEAKDVGKINRELDHIQKNAFLSFVR